MIEDSEIKTTVSPFAIRPGEIKREYIKEHGTW